MPGLLHGPTRSSYASGTSAPDLTSEEELEDGHRAFVYVRLIVPLERELAHSNTVEHWVTVVVRFYNALVHQTQADMSYDNTDVSEALPAGWMLSELPAMDALVTEADAFAEGYLVYDFIKAWSHRGPGTSASPHMRRRQRRPCKCSIVVQLRWRRVR